MPVRKRGTTLSASKNERTSPTARACDFGATIASLTQRTPKHSGRGPGPVSFPFTPMVYPNRYLQWRATLEKLDRVSALLDEIAQLPLGHPDRLRLLSLAEQIFEGSAAQPNEHQDAENRAGDINTLPEEPFAL